MVTQALMNPEIGPYQMELSSLEEFRVISIQPKGAGYGESELTVWMKDNRGVTRSHPLASFHEFYIRVL